jgi:hypothetical protein
MYCPVCKALLTEREVEGVGIHFCAKCRGLLCSRESFRQYVSVLRESELEQLSTAELFDRKALPEVLIPAEGKMCPGCGQAMEQFNYAYDSNIILDRCAKCGLIWADRGEIVKVAQYVRGNPAIDRFGQALADRETERAKYQRMAERGREIRAGGLMPMPFWIGLLPLSDEEETRTIPVATVLLILVNTVVFFLLPPSMDTFESLGFIPDLFFAGRELHRIVTHQFLHGGLLHLFGNMLFLWIFGDNVEDRFGKVGFPLVYLFLGGVAAVSHAIMTTHTFLPCVGASGAISGVMGSYFVLFPVAMVRAVIGNWMVPVPAFLFLAVWFLLQLAFSSLESSIAYFAHIGGFIMGLVVALGYKALRHRGR